MSRKKQPGQVQKLLTLTHSIHPRPVPGTPVDSPDGADPSTFPKELPTEDEANDEQKKLLQQALANFALIVLEPHHVDVADLGSQPNRRTVYSLHGGEWSATEVVP